MILKKNNFNDIWDQIITYGFVKGKEKNPNSKGGKGSI